VTTDQFAILVTGLAAIVIVLWGIYAS